MGLTTKAKVDCNLVSDKDFKAISAKIFATTHQASDRVKLASISLSLLILTPQVTSVGAVAQPAPTTTQLCPAQLPRAINNITNRPQLVRSRWGILIQTLSQSQTLYSHDATKYFIPASTLKLLTTAVALRQLGSQYRIRTSIYGSNNHLRIVGRGDPSLTDTQLQQLAQQLQRQGIRQVNQLIATDNYFRGAIVNPTWEWEDVQANYGAPISSLNLNQNAVELKLLPQQIGQPLRVIWTNPAEAVWWQIENRSVTVKPDESTTISVNRYLTGAVLKITGKLSINAEPETVSLAVIEPSTHFLRHFRRALITEGISVANTLVANTTINPQERELAAVISPSLAQLLIETNQNSNNLYAEALLRTLAIKANNTTITDSAEIGLDVVKTTLTALGVDSTSYDLADGSGLSRHNLVTPTALVQTLKAMAYSNVYRASLPVAGISGTLKNRFQNTPAEGIVQAKTGTMSSVVALSGYLNAPNYKPLVFSIIVNQSDLSATEIRKDIDEIVLLLTRLHRC